MGFRTILIRLWEGLKSKRELIGMGVKKYATQIKEKSKKIPLHLRFPSPTPFPMPATTENLAKQRLAEEAAKKAKQAPRKILPPRTFEEAKAIFVKRLPKGFPKRPK